MSKKPPLWKGNLIDRTYIYDMCWAAFKRAAKGKPKEEIGALVNDLERYMAAELLLNTSEVIGGVRDELGESLEFLKKMAGGIDEKIMQRRAQALVEKEEGKEGSDG